MDGAVPDKMGSRISNLLYSQCSMKGERLWILPRVKCHRVDRWIVYSGHRYWGVKTWGLASRVCGSWKSFILSLCRLFKSGTDRSTLVLPVHIRWRPCHRAQFHVTHEDVGEMDMFAVKRICYKPAHQLLVTSFQKRIINISRLLIFKLIGDRSTIVSHSICDWNSL